MPIDISYLPNDRGAYPLWLITVRLAATIMAYELDNWDGMPIPEGEKDAFLNSAKSATIETHQWENVLPTGLLKRARDEIESSICEAIDRKRLIPQVERRTLAGRIIPEETSLDLSDLMNWGAQHGILYDDWFSEYLAEEQKLAEDVLGFIEDRRKFLRNQSAYESLRVQAESLESGRVIELLLENERLKKAAQASVSHDSPSPRERSNMLRVIRALDVMAALPLRGAATSIETQLQQLGFDGPRDSTIRKLIDEARALEQNKKT